MNSSVRQWLFKLSTIGKSYFILIDGAITKPDVLPKTKIKPILWLIILFGICFYSLQLNASEASEQTSSRVSVNKRSLPKLISYSPMPCVVAGSSLTIRGSHFEQLDPTQEGSGLIIELNGKPQPIEYQKKSNVLIMVTLPRQLEDVTRIRIGLLADKNWRQNSLEITICLDDDQPIRSSTEQEVDDENLNNRNNRRNDNSHNRHNNNRVINEERENSKPEPQSEAQPKPEPDKPDPDSASRDANNELKRRIANRQTGGSLIGTGLPSLPQALILNQPSDASSYVNNELVAVSVDIDQAKQLAQMMSGYKARVIRRKTMSALSMVLTTFRLAPGNNVNNILTQLRNNNPDIWIDANHFYYPSEKGSNKNKTNKKKNNNRANLFNTIGLVKSHQCHATVKIGILDGPVEQTNDSLAQQSILQKQMFSRGKKSASTSHGTAIASLLVGSPSFPELAGVISHAELIVAVVMQAQPDDDKKSFTTTENLILGLNWLVEQQVNVINLSLGGSRNALLEVTLNKVLELDIGIVAAAGNSGSKTQKSYPAAQAGVIAVSAVDSDANLADDATQGDYIELTAPGVDLWVASKGSAAHYLSGSSLAAPLVAAALAQLGGSPKQSAVLFKTSKDLGKPGKDSKFGWGLLQFPACND